jgi:phage I-like protein
MRVNLSEIVFAEGESSPDISKVQLLRAGKYKYWDGSPLEITSEMLSNMKKNFDSKVKKIDLAIDYFHNAHAEAAGWIQDVMLEANNTELWVFVDWTNDAKEKILAKEIRYLSADFDLDYEDNESSERFGPTLNGGGLTNRPFVKGMNPILSEISHMIDKCPEKLDHIKRILSDETEKGTKQMNFDDVKKAIVSLQLSDDQRREMAHLMMFEDQTKQLSDQLALQKVQIESKDAEIKKLSDEAALLKKESEFAVLLSDGKAVPAQKEAYMLGDMAAFVRLSVPVNLSASGSGASNGGDDMTKEQAEAEVLKLSEAKAKESNIMLHEAIKIVLSENPKLKALAA